jgi:hypothetical protein
MPRFLGLAVVVSAALAPAVALAQNAPQRDERAHARAQPP